MYTICADEVFPPVLLNRSQHFELGCSMLIRAQDSWIDLLSRTLSVADLYLIQLLASSVLKDSRFATSLSMSLVRRRERCHAAAAATKLMLDIKI